MSLLAFVPYVTIQIRGAGIVIEAVTDGHIPLWLGALVAYGIVIVYVLVSGVMAVGWTNTFQGIFMVVIAWTLGLYLPYRLYGGVGPMFEQIAAARPELLVPPGLDAAGAPWSWGAYSTYILVSAVGLMMWPHLFMKAYTATRRRYAAAHGHPLPHLPALPHPGLPDRLRRRAVSRDARRTRTRSCRS